jgi:hypothetical protein
MKLLTISFVSSFALAVAAGWGALDAGPEQEGAPEKPALRTITVGDARVAIELDRDRVPAGESITVRLASIEPKPGQKPLDLEVTLLEQSGSPMSRSMPPPMEVSRTKVQLAATTPSVLAFKLDPRRTRTSLGVASNDPLQIAGSGTQYTVVVTAPGKKNAEGAAAYVPLFAYHPEAYQLTIEPPASGSAKAGETLEVRVRVKSLADKKLRNITLGMSSTFATIEASPVVAELAPGAETVVTLTARVNDGGMKALGANPAMWQVFGWAEYGGTAAAYATVDAGSGKLVARASRAFADPMLLIY